MTLVHQDCVFVQFCEGVLGDFRSDEWVTITVAADPTREAELGIGLVESEVVDIPPGIFPGEFEGAVESQDDFRKNFGEVGEGVAKFFLNVWALHENFAGIPEGLKFGAE